MKRFYTLVSTRNGVIELDGRPVKTPLKADLIAPNEALANALVTEWSNQGEEIVPDSMPLTQILSTEIDKVQHERGAMQTALLKYLDTDLLCYRAPEPPELKTAQEASWEPHLQWFEDRFGTMQTTKGLGALTQDKNTHEAVQAYIAPLSSSHFNLLQLVSALSGSLILGLAFVEKKAAADGIFAAMRVEENFKAKLYNEALHGPDPAQDEKDQAIVRDLKAAEAFRDLL